MRKILTALLLLAITPQLWGAKEALLIANADYSHFGKLPNPLSDARQLADVLRQIGFNVNLVENASRERMLDALGSFEERLKASGGIALFHYGGHGVQVDGKNFLIPADADIPDEKRVATRAVDVDEVMSALDASGSSVNVVVLDACRDNPLPATSTRSATRGLSVVAQKPKNSIIIYAAEAGSKAQDGLFTPTLAKEMAVPGRTISELMTRVRREVYQNSGGTQTPGEYTQLFDPVVLADGNVQAKALNDPANTRDPISAPPSPRVEEITNAQPASPSPVKSYWNHNGSVMGLIANGDHRTFIYVKPRNGLQTIIEPGSVLFEGTADGKSYNGTARRFRKGLPPNVYSVSGPIKNGGSRVVLTGAVATRAADGSVEKTFNDVLVFDLLPDYSSDSGR
jgi:Caspase domain